MTATDGESSDPTTLAGTVVCALDVEVNVREQRNVCNVTMTG